MCFSATASFGSSAILFVAGIASLQKAKNPGQVALASIPFIFGIQQLAEGFVWMSFINESFYKWRNAASYSFLLFAQVVWPIWIPLAMLMLEEKKKRKHFLFILFGAGVVLSTFLGYCLVFYKVSAETNGHHLRYLRNYPPGISILSRVFYGLVTVLPLVLVTTRKVWIIGVLVGISYIVTALLYKGYILSIWCYFAAIISIYIYILLPRKETAM